jgi:CheY-like chemotaxis protein
MPAGWGSYRPSDTGAPFAYALVSGVVDLEQAQGPRPREPWSQLNPNGIGTVATLANDLPKILIVEDDASLQAILWRATRAASLEAIALLEGSRALEVAADEQPDLILLDIEMPGADGRDILRDLKRDPRTKRIPVFMYTGMQSPHDRRLSLELGAEKYFVKPFELGALMRRIVFRLGKLGPSLEEPSAIAGTPSDGPPMHLRAPKVTVSRNETTSDGACEHCDNMGKVWLMMHIASRRKRWLCAACRSISMPAWITVDPQTGGGHRPSKRRRE